MGEDVSAKLILIHEYFKDKGVYFCVTGSANSNKKLQLRKFYRELLNLFPGLQDQLMSLKIGMRLCMRLKRLSVKSMSQKK